MRSERSITIDRHIVHEIFGPEIHRNFAVRYWNGIEERGGQRIPLFTIVLRNQDSLRSMFFPPSELRIARAYVRGDFDIEGQIEEATALSHPLLQTFGSLPKLVHILFLLSRQPHNGHGGYNKDKSERTFKPTTSRLRRHARKRDKAAIQFHYDVGNSFYALWLDRRRVYSCAYFPTGTETLDDAQREKIDLICRKLRLGKGETLLDIGCGWGALILHASRYYGVKALGITLSREQAQYAAAQIELEGMKHLCKVELRDYRDLPSHYVFDKVVSVGMFEHLGPAQLNRYFNTVYSHIKPGGLFLNHGIVSMERTRKTSVLRRIQGRFWRTGDFIDEYVFPDGELVPLMSEIGSAEAEGFETRDVESLREHYARTLRLWLKRLERARHDAIAVAGEPTYRVWRLYMAASAHGFAIGRLNIAQVLFARPDKYGHSSIPWSRDDIYNRSEIPNHFPGPNRLKVIGI